MIDYIINLSSLSPTSGININVILLVLTVKVFSCCTLPCSLHIWNHFAKSQQYKLRWRFSLWRLCLKLERASVLYLGFYSLLSRPCAIKINILSSHSSSWNRIELFLSYNINSNSFNILVLATSRSPWVQHQCSSSTWISIFDNSCWLYFIHSSHKELVSKTDT